MIGLTVAAEDGETELFGKDVSELQENIALANGKITGTLKYIADYSAAGYTEGGNFLALKVSSSESVEGATYTVTIEDDDPARSAVLDSDMNVIIQVKDKDKLKITVKAEKTGYVTDIQTYTCEGLTCEEE